MQFLQSSRHFHLHECKLLGIGKRRNYPTYIHIFQNYRKVTTLTFKSLIIGCSGLISNTLLPRINSKLLGSPSVWAFINLQKPNRANHKTMRCINGREMPKWLRSHLSILADHPNLPDTRTHGEELRRLEIWTLATLSPNLFFIQSHVWPNSCLISLSFSSFLSPAK